jgi:hypothetical protein
LHNNPCYAFSFLSEERAAIEKMERLSYVVWNLQNLI